MTDGVQRSHLRTTTLSYMRQIDIRKWLLENIGIETNGTWSLKTDNLQRLRMDLGEHKPEDHKDDYPVWRWDRKVASQ